MLKRTHVLVVCAFLVSLSLWSQESSSGNSGATPAKVSKDALLSRGFSFDQRKLQMCEIKGPEGACRVEAFQASETTTDKAANTCGKLDKSTYVGHCVNGKLEGLSLVIADGSAKLTREAYLSYFHEGHIAYPALISYLVGEPNFGVREERQSYGCVYFGKWDKSAERCKRFADIYGAELFTESNATSLREGTFDLEHFRAKFQEYFATPR